MARKLKTTHVIEALYELFVSRDIPAHIRSDNGLSSLRLLFATPIVAVGPKTAAKASVTATIWNIQPSFCEKNRFLQWN